MLVLRPNGAATTRCSTCGPASSRETDEFFRSRYGELWVGRRHTLAEKSTELGVDTADLTDLERRSPSCAPGRTRVLRGFDAEVDAAVRRTTATEDRHAATGELATPSRR